MDYDNHLTQQIPPAIEREHDRLANLSIAIEAIKIGHVVLGHHIPCLSIFEVEPVIRTDGISSIEVRLNPDVGITITEAEQLADALRKILELVEAIDVR